MVRSQRLKYLGMLGNILSKFIPKNPGVFFATAFVSSIVSRVILKIMEQELSQTIDIVFSLSIALIIDRIFQFREDKIVALKELNNTWRISSTTNRIAGILFEISSKEYPPHIEKQIRKLNTDVGLFLDNTELLYNNWENRIDNDMKWRLLLHRIIYSNIESVKYNKFSLPLSNYLTIILDTIELWMNWADEEGSSLVVYSFTNALPRDWFYESNPVVGESMETYSNDLARLVSIMKRKGYEFSRYILCCSHLEDEGFKSKEDVIFSWKKCNQRERIDYLQKLHTDEDSAFYLELFEDIRFAKNYTELVYFGFGDLNKKSIRWKWCYACSYTNNNLNVSATFIDLNQKSNQFIIDVENERKLRVNSMTVLDRYQVMVKDFPDHISNVGGIQKIKNILPLSVKWNLAAKIWHDNKEKEMLQTFLRENFESGSSILDCACGTGFHTFLLSEEGYEVTASDYDDGNIKILKENLQNAGTRPTEIKTVDWNNLGREFAGKNFDGVLCLGSSITYFESWDEQVTELEWGKAKKKLKNILKNFRVVLKDSGKLVIGTSRHYDERVDATPISFKPKIVGDVMYNMDWELIFDWHKRKKTWVCRIIGDNGDDYSFTLQSHLLDTKELVYLCKSIFGSKNVQHFDLDSSFYDTFIVCSV